jgi:hypothetical protein
MNYDNVKLIISRCLTFVLSVIYLSYMNKYQKCCYCNDDLEIHHISLHQRQCYLNPTNLRKICDYLIQGIRDNRVLKRASFYRWAQKEGILTSISITNRLKAKSWSHALYKLLVFGYQHDMIDYEYCEVILYIISSGSLWMPPEDFKYYYNLSLEKEYKEKGISPTDLHYNRFLLLMYVLDRANRDLEMNNGDLDENKEVVNLVDAIEFYIDFTPELLKSKIKQGKVSDDALIEIKKRGFNPS